MFSCPYNFNSEPFCKVHFWNSYNVTKLNTSKLNALTGAWQVREYRNVLIWNMHVLYSRYSGLLIPKGFESIPPLIVSLSMETQVQTVHKVCQVTASDFPLYNKGSESHGEFVSWGLEINTLKVIKLFRAVRLKCCENISSPTATLPYKTAVKISVQFF